MSKRTTLIRAAQLIVVLLCAFILKHLYSTASVNELRWILAPTTFLVEVVSGRTFSFELHAGYLSSDRSFLIAGSCAGVNFLIAAFLMLSIARLLKQNLSWKFIPAALVISYVTTIVANTARISTTLQLQQMPFEIEGLTANQLHRLEGILIYFGFLLLLFLISEQVNQTTVRPDSVESNRRRNPIHLVRDTVSTRPSTMRQFLFPLLIYYATTLGMPLGNALYRREIAASAFWEHSAFVLLAPILLMIPIATFYLFRVALQTTRKSTNKIHVSLHG